MAAVILENISPIMSIAMVSLIFIETTMTDINTKKLPRLAAITILHFEIIRMAKIPPKRLEPKIMRATPKLAPELMPNTKGPAKGFLNKVCISNPEIPKPEPTKIAVIAFGSLKSVMITSQVEFSILPKRLEKILLKGIFTDPKLIFTKKEMTNTSISIRN